MLWRSFFMAVLFSTVFQASASDYQKISGQLELLENDPMQTLALIETHIESVVGSFSQEERIILTHRLIKLKELLCSRPGQVTLTLPTLSVLFFAGKLVYNWYHLVNSRNSSIQSLYLSKIGSDAEYFWISFLAMIVLSMDHQYHVDGLFTKERDIEKKINSLIALLNKQ